MNTNAIIRRYILKDEWRVNENANIDYSMSSLMFHLSSKAVAKYLLTKIYGGKIADAHCSGDLHIHDLGTGISGYCAGWSLQKLLLEGFNGVENKIESKPPKHLDTALLQIVNFLGTLQNEWCYDEETEILTEKGWKYFKDINYSDNVLTRNESGYLEYNSIDSIYSSFYEGDMYYFKNRMIDLLVTPDHKMLIRSRKGIEKLVKAKDVKQGSIIRRGSWKRMSPSEYIVPSMTYTNCSGKHISPSIKIDSSVWAGFLGIYLAEGHVDSDPSHHHWRIGISQKNPRKVKIIKELLDNSPLKYTIEKRKNGLVTFLFYSRQLWEELAPLGKAKDKYVPNYLKMWNKEDIKTFLDFYLLGDGYQNTFGTRFYYTISKHLADDIQEFLVKIGKNTTCRQETKKLSKLTKKECKIYVVVERILKDSTVQNSKKKRYYRGNIYCCEVTNHTLCIRRNGEVCFSGNSGAQAINSLDTLLAPYVRSDKLGDREVKQAMQTFIYNLNIASRWGGQCVSVDTESLTEKGWKKYNEIKGEKIATFNIEKKAIEYLKPTKITSYDFDGYLYRLKNRTQDQLITPRHRLVRKKFNTNKYELIEIEKIADFKTPILVPIASKTLSNREIDDNKLKLIAWLVSDGSFSHGDRGRVTIYQSTKHISKCNEIRNILKKLGLQWNETIRKNGKYFSEMVRFKINQKGSSWIRNFINSKEVPSFIKTLSLRQIRLFIETYSKGDGWKDGNRIRISADSKEIRDSIQELCVLGLYGTKVSQKHPNSWIIHILRPTASIQRIQRVRYKGKVWCPTTENGTFIARREGRVFITGNTPFTNVTFDLTVPDDLKNQSAIVGGKALSRTYADYDNERDMINRAFLEVLNEGDMKGRPFTFPIPTYGLTKSFDWNSDIANLLFKVTAKFGLPYFSNFITSDMEPSDTRSMCCRLRLDLRELRKNARSGIFGSGDMTGSLGVVTINMPRIGYFAKSEDDYFGRLGYLMGLAKDSLEKKRALIEKNIANGLLPFTKRYLGNLKHHFSTIGLIGMNEACLNYLHKDIGTEDGREFSISTLRFMRDTLKEFQRDTKHIYNLEATPAEGTAYRLAHIDRKKYRNIITAGKDVPYYTNCVSGDTECLTINGWKKYFELKKQDKILTLNMNNKTLEFQPIERVHTQKIFDALMYRIKSKRQDQLISPNHKMLIGQSGNKTKYRLESIQKLPNNFSIPLTERYDSDSVYPISDDMIKLFGWIISEGHFEKDNSAIRIVQAEWRNKEKFDEIRLLLDRLGFDYSVLGDKRGKSIFRIKAKDGKRIRKFIQEKRIPRFVLNQLSKKQLLILFETLMKGDGSISGNRSYYSTKSHGLSDDFQELCIKIGKGATIRNYLKKTSTFHIIPSSSYHTQITKQHLTEEKYTGTIWCPSTVNKTFVARRNGIPFLTGNSTNLPVNNDFTLSEALKHQEELQPLYTGGSIFHIFLGESFPHYEGCKVLIKKIVENFKIPYLTFTPTYSICSNHGFISGEHFRCPNCNAKTEVYSRVTGYYRPVKSWNAGKQEEFRDRKVYKKGVVI